MANKYAMAHCSPDERVCHSTKEGEEDFIYMYQTVMKDLGVTLPFDTYEASVLWTLGKAGWVSLSPIPKASLFNAYLTSYKGFKNRFVKIKIFGGTSFASN
ncbi:hypothetical protein CR513_56593, partial [Mucuna pruriens]